MALSRRLTFIDRVIGEFDKALQTLTPNTQPFSRPSPSCYISEPALSANDKKRSARLMRVNHTGEVCAQALYQGQALTAKLPSVRDEMRHAANEEQDHLAWCEQRIKELNSHASWLNPAWYGLSFTMGAVAGLISDKVSLGFVAATEEQVCQHLASHLQLISDDDTKSRVIIKTMLDDEARHAQSALDAGGVVFPGMVKSAMSLSSTLMTKTSYYI